nr:MAG TPA: hypothetical protein [Caudoviricetes sp.]
MLAPRLDHSHSFFFKEPMLYDRVMCFHIFVLVNWCYQGNLLAHRLTPFKIFSFFTSKSHEQYST